MYFPHRYRTLNGKEGLDNGKPIKYQYVDLEEIELYNLKEDPSEKNNVYNQFPDIVNKIVELADIKRGEIGDDLTGKIGSENRPIGKIE